MGGCGFCLTCMSVSLWQTCVSVSFVSRLSLSCISVSLCLWPTAESRASIPMLFPAWDLGSRYRRGFMVAPLPPPPDAAPPGALQGHELYHPWAGPGARLPHLWLAPLHAPSHRAPLSSLDLVSSLAVPHSLPSPLLSHTHLSRPTLVPLWATWAL